MPSILKTERGNFWCPCLKQFPAKSVLAVSLSPSEVTVELMCVYKDHKEQKYKLK